MLCLALKAYAKDDLYKNDIVNRRTFGFSIQEGIPFYKLPEGKSYKPTGIIAVYHQPLFKAKRLVNVGVDIMPQIWFSKAMAVGTELGLNLSFNLNIQIKKTSILSFQIGSGIHYFGMETKRQADGFIFSDNFLGSYKRMIVMKNKKRIQLGFITGYRHLSNLSIHTPNTGIDNIMAGFIFDRIF